MLQRVSTLACIALTAAVVGCGGGDTAGVDDSGSAVDAKATASAVGGDPVSTPGAQVGTSAAGTPAATNVPTAIPTASPTEVSTAIPSATPTATEAAATPTEDAAGETTP